jgi:LacI family transcriptional regulator
VVVDIREVARVSGVSTATVSRALNGRPDVSEATRAKVMETARHLGYLPNQQARALVRRKSDTVGLIWDTQYVRTHGRQTFLNDLFVGLKMALADTGYNLLLLSPQSDEASVDAFVRIAGQHSLEGVALMAVDEHLPAVDALIASGRPCVGLDIPVRGRRATYVSTDNRYGAALAVRHLHDLGHRRIAMITGPTEMLPAAERFEGYRATMAELGLDVPSAYVMRGNFFLDSGRACMERLLSLSQPPTAVFVASDLMAVGAMNAAVDAGVRVPEDMSIVGYDDIELADVVRPALTTVTQDYLAMGHAAVDLLRALIESDDDPSDGDGLPHVAGPEFVPGRLVVRQSTARVPTS